MAIPFMEDDVETISKLGDTPGVDDGLTTEQLKAAFDRGSRLIKAFINNVLVPGMNQIVDVEYLLKSTIDTTLSQANRSAEAKATGEALNKKLSLTGGTMTGALFVLEPTENAHAASKKYADDCKAEAKKYCDDKHLTFSVPLPQSGWTDAAPYTQTIAVEGILATDMPHWSLVYPADAAMAVKCRDAFSAVDDLDTAYGSITFTCYDNRPETDLTIQMEVNR